MKKILLLMCAIAISWGSYAQEITVSGTVTSTEDGSTLPGVNVLVKGTANGTSTDADGKYSLSVPASGGILVFSFIGLKAQEIEVGGRSVIDISLSLDATELSEVVVTALGIKREVKSLPYAAQSVSSEKLNLTRANNVNEALAGKVAGVQVRGQSGAALGRNSSIRIRGAGSLNDKEPLYIIDGTPVTNSQDFNPDDIESINVLKGPTASALYGQRGDAGVILVTTKKGTKGKGMGINVSQNVFFDNIYVLPQYQNSYAGGAVSDLIEFHYEPGMPAEWQTLDGKFYHDYTDDASWGPRMNGQEYIPWYAWAPGTKYTGQTTKLLPQPNNIRDFYETGVNAVTNVSFAKATEAGSVRLSYTYQDQKGILPNTGLNKNTVALSTSVNLSKLITVGANINFVNTVINGEFDDAYSNQSTGSFNQWFHRNLDMNKMRELQGLKSPEGRLVSWNHFNPTSYLTDGDKFYRGYYWYNHLAYFNQIDYQQNRNRLFGDVNLTFNILENLKASVFYRKNQNVTNFENKRPSILPYSFYTENRPTNQPQWDFYGTAQTFFKEDNLEFLLAYNTRFLNDDMSFDVSGGGNLRMEESSNVSMNTVDGLNFPDLFTISNSKGQMQYDNTRAEKQVRSLYMRGTLGYKETFFVDFTARNDWSSALPEDANSYFYPSVGATFVFSELTESALPVLSFGKLRAAWAQVGSDLNAYSTTLAYSVANTTWNGSPISGTPDTEIDPNIKPSLSSSYEFGLDLKFLSNRLGASITYFDETKTDEILTVPVSGSSGYTSKIINAGEINRNGIEIALDGTPVQTNNFRWDVSLNFAKIEAKVVELTEGVDAILAGTGGASFNVAPTYHVVGEEWGQLRGLSMQRVNGVPVLNASGLYVPTAAPVNFGSILPDFTGGLINTFSYSNFTLQFNIDFQKGGQFYSLSDQWGTFSGLTKRTAGVNDLGMPLRDPVAEGGGVHVFGVKDMDATAGEDFQPFDMYVDAQSYYHQFYNAKIADPHIYDLTYVKLRELSLGYNIPVQKLGALGKVFTSASVSVVGRNLWLISTNVEDFDPSEIASAFGENGQFPSVRSYGFNVKFGF
jgi:TonB-linked SusC/RagA family outer membrane protein